MKIRIEVQCELCKGNGYVDRTLCPYCDGKGWIKMPMILSQKRYVPDDETYLVVEFLIDNKQEVEL